MNRRTLPIRIQDKYLLEQEFLQWIDKQGIVPRDVDALFLEFCRGRAKKAD